MKKQTIILPIYQRNTLLQIAGVSGIFFALFSLLIISYCLSQSPWFDWQEHFLSDMGVLGSTVFVFNAGIVFIGICATLYGLGYTYVSSNQVASSVFLAGGIAFIFVGLFPLSYFWLHALFVSAAFILSISAIIHLSFHSRKPPLGTFEYGLSAYMIAAIVFGLLSLIPSIFFGSFAASEVVYFIAISVLIIPTSVKMLNPEVMMRRKRKAKTK